MKDYRNESVFLRAIAHPARLKICRGLLRHDCNVGKMVRGLGLPQSTVSQHLALLRARGIVACEKKGKKTCYRVADPRVRRILAALEQAKGAPC
ncbi:MAG: ArsR/SmtB family transcription factor [Deltaproteobacteria bacterium]